MRRFAFLAAAVALAAPFVAASSQTVRWNDRARETWEQARAPHVRVWIENGRFVPMGGAVRVHFEVSEDAYVVVGRVADDGRLTILFPSSRTQRAFVTGNVPHFVRGRRAGGYASFFATDMGGSGYVFALASALPLDMSRFGISDFERTGHFSDFSMVSRRSAFRPDEYIERFAGAVLWENDAPFEYDVDYYATDRTFFAQAASFCGGSYNSRFNRLFYDWEDRALGGSFYNPYYGLCWNYLDGFTRCLGLVTYSGYGFCQPYNNKRRVLVQQPPSGPVGDTPSDSGRKANVGIIRGGLWAPDTVGRVIEDERPDRLGPGGVADPVDRPVVEPEDTDWERVYAIPERALRNMREAQNDLRRRDAGAVGAPRGWAGAELRGRGGEVAAPNSPELPRSEPRRDAPAVSRPQNTGRDRVTSGSYEPPRRTASPRGATAPPSRPSGNTESSRERPRSDAGSRPEKPSTRRVEPPPSVRRPPSPPPSTERQSSPPPPPPVQRPPSPPSSDPKPPKS